MHRTIAIIAALWAAAVLGQDANLPPVPKVVYECGFSYRHVPYLLQIVPTGEVAIVAGQAYCGNPKGDPELRGSFLLRLRPLRQADGPAVDTPLTNGFYVYSPTDGWTASGHVPIKVLYRDTAPPLVLVNRYHSCDAVAMWFFVADVTQPALALRTVHFSTGGDGAIELLGTGATWVAASGKHAGSLVISGHDSTAWGRYLSQFAERLGAAGVSSFIRSGLYTDQAGTYEQAAAWLHLAP